MKMAWQQIPSPVVTEILCNFGDGVVIDTEHGCFNNETIAAAIQIATLKGKHCFVRLTEISNSLIRYCLDSGATGLIFSTIESGEQISLMKKYSYYPPNGNRGLGLVRANNWGIDGLLSKDPILVAQIESKKGVDNLDDIINHGWLDYYLIGPYDLSLSLNIPGQFHSEEFLCYTNKIESKIPPKKMAVHIPTDINKNIEKYKNYGLKCLGMDTIALLEYHKRIL